MYEVASEQIWGRILKPHRAASMSSRSPSWHCVVFVLPLLHCLILFVCVFQISASDRVSALFCLLRGWL